ncbi:uncharacterized protein [Primulina eburnea]|uniref:uncharacterized protein n=1 Tax=Primulina eburnea TaxID=1245227 RepID=UPI003C6C90FF
MMQNKGVEFSYFKPWRGRQLALDKLLGSPEESYRIMPPYLYMIEQVNRGSKTDLKLKEFINDDPNLVIISDRHISIINVVRTVYEHASYVHCSWHLSQNLKRVSGGKGEIDLFMKTTYAYKVSEFDELYGCLKERYPNIASYLEMHSSPDKWSRAYSPGARYNIMTTNRVESINAKLKTEREMTIVALFDAIHKLTSKWFNKHRNAAGSATTTLTPSTEAILRANFTLSQRLKASQLNAFEYNVYDDGKDEVVNLFDRSCSCRVFQIDKIPCAHAIVAIYGAKSDLYDFCSPYYTSQMWALAYADTIYPVPIANEWNISRSF